MGLSSRGRFGPSENLTDAEESGVWDGDAQGVFAPRLREAVFQMDVVAGISRQGSGDAHVDVGSPITNFYTFTEEVSKRRH